MGTINPPVELADPSNKTSFDYVLTEVSKATYDYPPVCFFFNYCSSWWIIFVILIVKEFFDHVQRLWADKGIQACFERANEYQLIDCAK